MKIKTMTRMALLSAIALTIFWVEAQIPMPISVPGVKLGLANVVTVYAVFSLGAWEAGGILLVRVLLGSLFTGQMMSLLYSAVGGVLALLTALGLKRILTGTQIWVASCFSAVAHNLGQIARRDCHHPDSGAPVLSASPFGIRPAHRPLHRTRRPGLAPTSP